MDGKGVIEVRISNIDTEQAAQIIDLLKVWKECGETGKGRATLFYADGDGSFHPQIEVTGLNINLHDMPEMGEWKPQTPDMGQTYIIVTD
jgi:hypothetical protein